MLQARKSLVRIAMLLVGFKKIGIFYDVVHYGSCENDISKEHTVAIFIMEIVIELETTLAVTNRLKQCERTR
jgi:hypothetical protein